MPSSKSSSARSKGTSPFSSSATIASRRWRDSSNLAKLRLPRTFYPRSAKSDQQEFEKMTELGVVLSHYLPPISRSTCRSNHLLIRSTTACLLYTSDAADEEDSVDLGGSRIIK